MGVYIKGMEMPTTCAKCPLGHINAKKYVIECYAEYPTKLFDYDLARHSTNPFCPLVPVPDHGRLVDADDVALQIDEWMDSVGTVMIGHGMSYYGELLGCIEDAPTIIEADKEDE